MIANFRLIKSYISRSRKLGKLKQCEFEGWWKKYGLNTELELKQFLQKAKKASVEIGFGDGANLLELAKASPQECFVGIETYQPGIAKLLELLAKNSLANVKVFRGDAKIVFDGCIDPASLDTVWILFPDPWPKRKHHKRRLIQNEFVSKLYEVLKVGGRLIIATDWEDYARQLERVLDNSDFKRMVFGELSKRLIVTKFETQGLKEHRQVYEFNYIK